MFALGEVRALHELYGFGLAVLLCCLKNTCYLKKGPNGYVDVCRNLRSKVMVAGSVRLPHM